MSQKANIDDRFQEAIDSLVDSEGQLLSLKLEVYESLEWEEAADETAKVMQEKGYAVPSYYEEANE